MESLRSAGSLATGSSGTCFKRISTLTLTPMRSTNFRGVWLDFDSARRVEITFGTLLPADRKARRTRTRPPCFMDGFATVDSVNISSKNAMDPTRTRKELDAAKSGLCFMQVVYSPQDQLSRTKRLEGAYELRHDEPNYL